MAQGRSIVEVVIAIKECSIREYIQLRVKNAETPPNWHQYTYISKVPEGMDPNGKK